MAATAEEPSVRAGRGGEVPNQESNNCANYEARFQQLNVNQGHLLRISFVPPGNNEALNALSIPTSNGRNIPSAIPELMQLNENLMITNEEREAPSAGVMRQGRRAMQAVTAGRPLVLGPVDYDMTDEDMNDEARKRKRRDGSSSSGTGSFLLAGPGSQACQEK